MIEERQNIKGIVNAATIEIQKEEQTKTIEPNFSNGNVIVTPDENKVLNSVTIAKDNDLTPSNIKSGVEVFGVTGTFDKTLGTKTITENGTYNATDDNLDGYSEVTVATEKYAPRYLRFQNYTGTELNYEINNLDSKNLTTARYMFYNCSNLISVPLFDTSNITDMGYMFQNCPALTSVPLFDTSKVTSMLEMFGYCLKLSSIPLFDTSKVTNMHRTFGQCNKLTEIPLFDTGSATDMGQLFYDCRIIQKIPALNTSNVTNVAEMFMSCSKLTTVPQLNFGKVTNVARLFYYTSTIVNLGGFLNLGNNYATNQPANYISYTLDLSSQKNLTHESIMNVINDLYDIASKGCNTQSLVLGSTNLAKLTEEEITIATNKGWTVS